MLALPPAPRWNRPGYVTVDNLDGVVVHVLQLPWSFRLTPGLAHELAELAWLARRRGWQLRVMRGVTELDVRDPGDDPAAVPGSSMAWELEKLATAADIITDHLFMADTLGAHAGHWRCGCGLEACDTDGGLYAEHLAEVLDQAGRLAGART